MSVLGSLHCDQVSIRSEVDTGTVNVECRLVLWMAHVLLYSLVGDCDLGAPFAILCMTVMATV